MRPVQTKCGEVSETTIVVASPQVRTRISDQTTKPGARITDKVIVEGLGAVAVTVKVALFGPFASKSAIRCTGTPYWRGTFSARGDGTYTTQPVEIDRVGYYTYRETIGRSEANNGTVTECADVAETTLATAQPAVTTIVSSNVVRRGSVIYDRILVSGLGKTPVRIGVELFGPFGTRDEIQCSGTPDWEGISYARGDGELRSASVRLARAGFYTYRERVLPAQHVAETETKCALVAETSLAAPAINTGRSRGGAAKQVPAQDSRAPTRVTIRSLGIDAPSIGDGHQRREGGARREPEHPPHVLVERRGLRRAPRAGHGSDRRARRFGNPRPGRVLSPQGGTCGAIASLSPLVAAHAAPTASSRSGRCPRPNCRPTSIRPEAAIASPSSRAVGRSSRPRALPRQRRRHRRSCLTLTTRRAEGASLRGRRGHRSRSLRRRGDRCRAEA